VSEEKKLVAFQKRKAIPNGVRFEVFKRDAFTCQYCGSKAPDVILNVDHIKPVADGGENEIVNLITSCFNCNSGKSDVALDDDAAIQKQRKQLEELNERRAQLEMMLAWRDGLNDLQDDYAKAIQEEFLKFSLFTANDSGLRDVKNWLRKYTFCEVIKAIDTSFTQYLVHDKGDDALSQSWNRAFKMVPKIIEANKRGGIPPDKMRAFYIRGVLRNRLTYVDERNVIDLIMDAVAHGADIESIVDFSKKVYNWKYFEDDLWSFILKHKDPLDGKN